jgi:hypothetical protein
MRTLALIVIGVAFVAGCGSKTEPSCSPAKEIATSSLVKTGDTWDAVLTSNIEAPVDKVLEAASHPEKGHDLVPESILKSEILSESGNVKTLDIVLKLDILPPGFKLQNVKNEYTYNLPEKRFTTKSIDFKLADITSEYRFEPSADGKGTLLKFTQKSKDKGGIALESLQKGAQCETFVIQVRAVRRALGLDKAPAAS